MENSRFPETCPIDHRTIWGRCARCKLVAYTAIRKYLYCGHPEFTPEPAEPVDQGQNFVRMTVVYQARLL